MPASLSVGMSDWSVVPRILEDCPAPHRYKDVVVSG